MYTVMRITGRPEQLDVLRGILADITRTRPDVAAEQRRRDGVVVCDISTDASWWDHKRAITRFIEDCSRPIETAATHDVGVGIDVAIDAKDMAPHPYFSIHCDVEFMKMLAERRVTLEFTVYGCHDTTLSADTPESDPPSDG